jgi:predicted secreted protein
MENYPNNNFETNEYSTLIKELAAWIEEYGEDEVHDALLVIIGEGITAGTYCFDHGMRNVYEIMEHARQATEKNE